MWGIGLVECGTSHMWDKSNVGQVECGTSVFVGN